MLTESFIIQRFTIPVLKQRKFTHEKFSGRTVMKEVSLTSLWGRGHTAPTEGFNWGIPDSTNGPKAKNTKNGNIVFIIIFLY